MQVSVLGMGAAEIGFQATPQESVTQLLNSALDAGLNVIDTAECYKDSEEKIGHAVAHRRREYHLFTKCGHASGINLPDWHPRLLEQQVDRSLRRLRTDHVDLLQLHSCSEEVLRQGDAIAVLRKARDAGKTRYIGYSGDGQDALYAVQCGVFDTLQTSLSIADQEPIDLTLPLARERRMGVIAKRPVANAAWRSGSKPKDPYQHTYWERLQVLRYPFLNGPTGLEEAIGIALRFTLAQEGVHVAIVGTTQPGRFSQNARLLEAGALPADTIRAIRDRWHAVAQDWRGQT